MQPEERFLDDILSSRAVAEHDVCEPDKAQRVRFVQCGHFPAVYLCGIRGRHRARTGETYLRHVRGFGFHIRKMRATARGCLSSGRSWRRDGRAWVSPVERAG